MTFHRNWACVCSVVCGSQMFQLPPRSGKTQSHLMLLNLFVCWIWNRRLKQNWSIIQPDQMFYSQDEKNQILTTNVWLNLVSRTWNQENYLLNTTSQLSSRINHKWINITHYSLPSLSTMLNWWCIEDTRSLKMIEIQ